jgi:hypothetical protein
MLLKIWERVYPYMAIIAVICLVRLFFIQGCKSTKVDVSDNPRDKNGVDTIYSDDSVYIINFKIDSAFKAKYQPQEQPERDY